MTVRKRSRVTEEQMHQDGAKQGKCCANKQQIQLAMSVMEQTALSFRFKLQQRFRY
jgi:hypothetical protein